VASELQWQLDTALNRIVEADAEISALKVELEKAAVWRRSCDNYETLVELQTRLDKVEDRFDCGHRKVDWDDSYGACVACLTKQAMFDEEDEDERFETRFNKLIADIKGLCAQENCDGEPYDTFQQLALDARNE